MKAYDEADKIEKQIYRLIDTDGINKDNAIDWLNFLRTIETTLSIIRERVKSEFLKVS